MNISNCPNCRKWIVLFSAACAVVFIQVIVLTVLISRRVSDENTAIPKAYQSASVGQMSSGTPNELLLKYAEQGEATYVESVLKQNPTLDVNRPRAEGNKTALYLACEKGYSDIVKLLLERKADAMICDAAPSSLRDAMKYSALTVAARNGNVEVMKLLLSSGVDRESRDDASRTALWTAAANNKPNVVQCLCEAKANVNAYGRNKETPLSIAVYRCYVEVVKTLLTYGEGIDLEICAGSQNLTPLFRAVKDNQPEIVELLCKAGAKVNVYSEDSTPLTKAASEGYTEIVKTLLTYGKGIDVEMKPKSGWKATPLFYAAYGGHTEVVEDLCKVGADLNAGCEYGIKWETPISIASIQGHEDVVKVLKKYEKERRNPKGSQESSRKKLENLLK